MSFSKKRPTCTHHLTAWDPWPTWAAVFWDTAPPGDADPAQYEAAVSYLAKKSCTRGASNQGPAPFFKSLLPPDYSLVLVYKESIRLLTGVPICRYVNRFSQPPFCDHACSVFSCCDLRLCDRPSGYGTQRRRRLSSSA